MAQAIVQRACAQLRSAIGDEALVRLNFTADLRDILEALEAIQPFLEDAEITEFSNWVAVKWLPNVRVTAYKIMDMVDELKNTRSLAAATITRLLPCIAIMKNAMVIRVGETKNRVREIQDGSHRYLDSPRENVMFCQSIENRKTGQDLEEAMVLGRGSDKERIMAVLMLSAEGNIRQKSITIFPIFGLAGIGKTTLAQMVFNDTHSLQGYNFRVWVHVSPKLDFHTVVESIIRQVSGPGGEEEIQQASSDVEGMEGMMKRLHKLLNGKKVLLVLDDLWEEDPIQLQLLKSKLTFLGGKLDVMVTTCNQAIARMICTIEPYKLNSLSDVACWETIKKSTHFQIEDKAELKKIRQETAWKCRGVPSAARIYACMLHSSEDVVTWKKNMENNIWPTFSSALSTFGLSYMSMPSDLRLCFDYYCAVFQNGHNIVKDDLIHQWMALHLIEQTDILSATQIAEEYIIRLMDRTFLQTANSDQASGKDNNGEIFFTMHVLVHDFTRRFVACLNYRLVTNHHGKLDYGYDNLRALRCVDCSKVDFNDGIFSRNKCLRVLELKESSVQKLPDSIWQLRHLGYLKISEFSGLVTLPECLGNLINLLHIDLSCCSRLVKLPESFGKLIRLVHANLSGCCGLTTLPESFGDLINLSHVNLSHCHALAEISQVLQKLDNLVHLDLSFWSCFEGIGKCLGGLSNLEHLNLSNPCCYLAQHRSHLQELKDGLCKLTKLRYLNLSMCLNPIFYYHQSQEKSLQYIADSLRGFSDLEHLDLSHNTFLFGLPESLGDLNKLHTLNLSGCIRLKRVGEMKSVKFLSLKNCRALDSCNFVVRVDDDAPYVSSNIVQLEGVNCQDIQIRCLENVRSIEEAQRIRLIEKQKLEKLKLSWTTNSHRSVEDSALLGELVPPPNLQCLEVNGYTGTCLPEYLGELTSLQELKIVCCKQLNTLSDSIKLKWIGKRESLKLIVLRNCRGLENFHFVVRGDDDASYISGNIILLESVNCQELQISCLENVRSIEDVQRIRFVEKQKLEKLKLSWTLDSVGRVEDSVSLGELVPPPNLQCLEVNGYAGTCLPEYLGELTSLQELKIVCCKQLNSLPDTMQKLTSLKDLYISDSPDLKKWCQQEENKKVLAHIPNKYYEEHASTSRLEIREARKSIDEVEAATTD